MSDSEGSGRGSAKAASITEPTPTEVQEDIKEEAMKRAAAKELIERYYFQLTEGCGKPCCSNSNCASCPQFAFKNLSRNEAFVKALDLLQKKVDLCKGNAPKVAKASPVSTNDVTHAAFVKGTLSSSIPCVLPSTSTQPAPSTSRKSSPTSSSPTAPTIDFLTEESVNDMLATCKEEGNWSVLIRTIGSVYSKPESLLKSFRRDNTKEDVHAMEADEDKDVDTSEECSSNGAQETQMLKHAESQHPDAITIDLESLRRTYANLFAQQEPPFQNSLINAVITLSGDITMELKYHNAYERNPDYLNIFVIIMEIPILQSPEFIDMAFPHFCKAMAELPLEGQVRLAKLWSKFSAERLKDLVGSLQQLISVKVISTPWERLQLNVVQDSGSITGATKLLSVAYYASILGGEIDSLEQIEEEKLAESEMENSMNDMFQGAIGHDPKEKEKPREDPLAKALGIRPMDCNKPLVPWDDFINEPLSDLDLFLMEKDYYNYRTETNGKFSFLNYPFILTPGAKHLGLYFDNKVRMLHERRSTMIQTIRNGTPGIPYLRLRVRRDHLIMDALLALEVAAMDNPQDLKKQLYVEFFEEEGVDEGGVSKEFFQLIVEEIFNPDIGMFILNEETSCYWFNPTSFENDGQFTLIGIVLGLAIYNSVILDVHFPMVVYKKLMGKKGNFLDLEDSHPSLHQGLTSMLEYEGNVEETFMQTFQVSYKDVFGNLITKELKDKGEEITVSNENRQEFVNLYSDFLLNKSVERQFRAFKRGFQMVTDESPLKVFFRPEEVELLVCGSKHYDFNALKDSAEYDGGFTSHSTTIKYFWDIMYELDDEQKRQLLFFTTGSDRVPVGGLSKLKLIIARNGPDSDRLPTAHTCFNVLLLPDYANKEKLKERLLKAITHAKGFGML